MTLASAQRCPSALPRGTGPSWAGGRVLSASVAGFSTQAVRLDRTLAEVAGHYASPASRQPDRRRERFDTLASQWRDETRFLSSTTDIAMHPAYQGIIGMGADALPYILEDLRTNSGHWFWALKAISNDDPVPPRDRGNIRRMTDAWLRWGEAKGLFHP